MLKKIVAVILASFILVYFPSCYSKQTVTYPEIKKENPENIKKFVTKSGDYYYLWKYIESDGDYILGEFTKEDHILLSEIESLTREGFNKTLQKIKPDELEKDHYYLSNVSIKLKNGKELTYDFVMLADPSAVLAKKKVQRIRIDDIQVALIEKFDFIQTSLNILAAPVYAVCYTLGSIFFIIYIMAGGKA